ncbi:MAG TPA: gephyrin-like molybdotransferase Glp [Actinomycetota bacterium]|nr:gephyrin-like molybdotransferase Glp [Actinomycetota bacterium]
MLTVDEARARILAAFSSLPSIDVPIREALGMVPTHDVVAPHPSPRFDNSAMDGYAVRRADLGDVPVTLEVIGEARAGSPPSGEVVAGTAIAVMTGAPVPAGADAVVPIEDADEDAGRVTVRAAPPGHGHIRPAGDDVRAGDLLVPAGRELDAGELAMLATMGLSPVPVHRRPLITVLSTGDELVRPEVEPGPGQIRDSNSVALAALVRAAGGEVRVRGPIADDRTEVERALGNAAAGSDLVVSSGGVSVGRYDFVRDVIEQRGRLDLWRVAMQPGKPVVSGAIDGTPFLGLPGNPVSIHVGFEQFVRPAIRKMRGCREVLRPVVRARIGHRIEKKPGRLHFVRVRLSFEGGEVVATPTGPQGSHIQSSLLDAHGVARFDVDETVLDAGAEVTVEVWRLP